MRAAALLCLVLAACDRAPARAPDASGDAGARLERAAIAAGVVAVASRPVGAYASDTDRVCIVPGKDGLRIGAASDYGEGHRCLARGEARAEGSRLAIDFGATCRFEARVDDAGVSFPAILPAGCDQRCTGRATLSALSAGRLSGSETEARSIRAANGTALCTD